jgi:hypothetical protein
LRYKRDRRLFVLEGSLKIAQRFIARTERLMKG